PLGERSHPVGRVVAQRVEQARALEIPGPRLVREAVFEIAMIVLVRLRMHDDRVRQRRRLRQPRVLLERVCRRFVRCERRVRNARGVEQVHVRLNRRRPVLRPNQTCRRHTQQGLAPCPVTCHAHRYNTAASPVQPESSRPPRPLLPYPERDAMRHLQRMLLPAALLPMLCAAQSNDAALILKARQIHDRVIKLDTHNDIDPANFTADCNYKMRLTTQVNLPKMIEGDMDVTFMIVYVGQGPLTPEGYDNAYRQAIAKFDAIHRFTEKLAPDQMGLALTPADVLALHKKNQR